MLHLIKNMVVVDDFDSIEFKLLWLLLVGDRDKYKDLIQSYEKFNFENLIILYNEAISYDIKHDPIHIRTNIQLPITEYILELFTKALKDKNPTLAARYLLLLYSNKKSKKLQSFSLQCARVFKGKKYFAPGLFAAISARPKLGIIDAEVENLIEYFSLKIITTNANFLYELLNCVRSDVVKSVIRARLSISKGDLLNAKLYLDSVNSIDQMSSEYIILYILVCDLLSLSLSADQIMNWLKSPDISADLYATLGERLAKLKNFTDAAYCLIRSVAIDRSDTTIDHFTKISRSFNYKKSNMPSLPMILISQVQRSGGTLVSELLDDHLEILSHPHELHIGKPNKWNWPQLNLSDSPEQWFSKLIELPLFNLAVDGYDKADGNKYARIHKIPFQLNLSAICAGFIQECTLQQPNKQRTILDIYFNVFFSNWRNHAGYTGQKYISSFVPRLISNSQSINNFWTDYPDGKLVSCLRNPLTWYRSISNHEKKYQNIEYCIELWRANTLSAIIQYNKNPHSVLLIDYDTITHDTCNQMKRIAKFLKISFSQSMLEPTFHGNLILSNSSFSNKEYGVLKNEVNIDEYLSREEIVLINNELLDLYSYAKSLILIV